MGRPKKNAGPKLPKNLPDFYPDSVAGKSTEDLRQEILKSTEAINETTAKRDDDPQYQELKDDFKTYADGYNEVLKAEKAKVGFVIGLLKERGAPVYVTTPVAVAPTKK